jgi:hypothetical protein
MAYALGNESRQKVMRRLGITENTLKTQVRSLLRKCSARSMDGLAKTVLRDALVFETQPVDMDADETNDHTTEDETLEVSIEVGPKGRMYA